MIPTTILEIIQLMSYKIGKSIDCSNETKDTRKRLIKDGLVIDTGGATKITDKGKQYVVMLINTPLPVIAEHWIDPRT
jgi:hypothetical protein